ncbi:hypothetical protein GCK72_015309 [Caenorhabditis remanei]|uniref:C2H2-type domain-containing protein n=1 Tax=Caenorhabditis remanei TaxID=31234 RepID=A0A6A5GWB8_CAERE|nr:hypothetical protein GCK72_015309 [Caenorhabditis remanei]KAF1758849.1 hypothetical protein GCK72_015309 [Caenorhabditis remanei]
MEDNDDQERSVLYCCILCPKSYKHAKSIRRHMTDDHRTEKGATYRIVTSNESREVVSHGNRSHITKFNFFHQGNGSYACDHCDLKFTKMEFWTEHLKTSHEDIYPEDIEERNFDDKDQFEVLTDESKE